MRANPRIHKIASDYIAEASSTRQTLDKCDSCFEGSVTNAQTQKRGRRPVVACGGRLRVVKATDNSLSSMKLLEKSRAGDSVKLRA